MQGECLPRLTAIGISYEDAVQLRRIAMTLHRWHELECGVGDGCISRDEKWAIERAAWPAIDRMRWWNGNSWGKRADRRTYSDDEKANYTRAAGTLPIDAAWRETGERPYWLHDDGSPGIYLADREAGAKRRLAKIMARYPQLSAYVQGDPRGASLYILKPGDVPAGENVGSYYSRGVAVYK